MSYLGQSNSEQKSLNGNFYVMLYIFYHNKLQSCGNSDEFLCNEIMTVITLSFLFLCFFQMFYNENILLLKSNKKAI